MGVAILKKRTESANVDRWPYDLSQNGHKFLSDEGPGFMASSCYGCKRLELVTARISRIQFAQRYVMICDVYIWK